MTFTLGTFLLSVSEILTSILVILGVLKKVRKKAEESFLREVKNELNDVKSEINSLKENYKENDNQTKLSLLRLEILSLIANDPKNHDTIYETFDEYTKNGGNHYIESVIRKWEKEQGID